MTIISPGLVESELANTITDAAPQVAMADYRKIDLTPDAIARAVAYATKTSGVMICSSRRTNSASVRCTRFSSSKC